MDALGINGPFLIAQIVNFVLLLLLLRAFLYKPVLKMLESRKQRIAEGLQAAEVAVMSLRNMLPQGLLRRRGGL